jgi:hypothetical protein
MRTAFDDKSSEFEKKRLVERAESAPDDITHDDIDPADFFDPEEFGYRRQRETSR